MVFGYACKLVDGDGTYGDPVDQDIIYYIPEVGRDGKGLICT